MHFIYSAFAVGPIKLQKLFCWCTVCIAATCGIFCASASTLFLSHRTQKCVVVDIFEVEVMAILLVMEGCCAAAAAAAA